MITLHHGKLTYTLPRRLGRKTAAIVEYAAAAYGFLLNTPERRGRPHTWAAFAELVGKNFAPGSTRDAVISALCSLR